MLKFLPLLAAFLASPVWAAPPTPDQVLTELNRARTDPAGYAASLRAYRDRFDGRVAHDSADDVGVMTNEGVAAVDDAIAFLEHQPPVVAMTLAGPLNRSAEAYALDQSRNGQAGHTGFDGSSFSQRIHREGNWAGEASEAISYGMDGAASVVRELIIDDGVPGRGHRLTLFDPILRNVGVGCEPHPVYKQVCVLDFATAVAGKN